MIVASTDSSIAYLQSDEGIQLVELIEPQVMAKIILPRSTRHLIYLLQSMSNPRRTYVGYTVDLQHRLRQHNGELVGGAKATRSGRPWRVVGYLTGFPTASLALQFEWRVQHPYHRRRVNGLTSRIAVWSEVLELEKWSELDLTMIWLDPQYRLIRRPSNVEERWNEI